MPAPSGLFWKRSLGEPASMRSQAHRSEELAEGVGDEFRIPGIEEALAEELP